MYEMSTEMRLPECMLCLNSYVPLKFYTLNSEMLHMMTKRVILIQQETFNKNISVILLTYSGKKYRFSVSDDGASDPCLCLVCIFSEKVDFA
jgi:hypothetical protein